MPTRRRSGRSHHGYCVFVTSGNKITKLAHHVQASTGSTAMIKRRDSFVWSSVRLL